MRNLLVPLDIPIVLGPEEARRRAEEELAKAKYGGDFELPDWLNRLFTRLGDLIDRLVDLTVRRPGSGQTNGDINWGFVILVAILVAAIVVIVWKVGVPRWNKKALDSELDLDSTKPPSDYRELAEHAAAAADWASAVRDRYRAVIRELELRTILEPRPARTAWEAATSAVRLLPEVQAALFGGAQLFNDVVYGDHQAAEEHYRQMIAFDEQILLAADRADLVDEAGVEEVTTSR